MKTNTKLAALAAAVAALAASLSLPRAAASYHHGQFIISYATPYDPIATHTEGTSNPDKAFARFADAATNGKWLAMLVDDDEAGEVFPLIEYARHNGTYYVGDRSGQTLPEIDAARPYEVVAVNTEMAWELAARWSDNACMN